MADEYQSSDTKSITLIFKKARADIPRLKLFGCFRLFFTAFLNLTFERRLLGENGVYLIMSDIVQNLSNFSLSYAKDSAGFLSSERLIFTTRLTKRMISFLLY